MLPTRINILALCALSGLLWALAWPGIGGFAPLAFAAWLPMLHAERLHDLRTATRPRAFVPYAMLGLFVWNASTSWWFFMVSEPLGTKLVSGLAPMVVNTLLMTLPWWLKRVVRNRSPAAFGHIALVVFWLSFERLHHAWDLQWPWFSMGNVFGELPAWIQWYEVTGMLGGGLWIWIVTLLLDRLLQQWSTAGIRTRLRGVTVAVLAISVPLALSLWRFHHYTPQGVSAEVVVVQPNVDPYSEKFGGVDPLDQLDRMLEQAAEVVTPNTVLLIFPETALQENATMDLRNGEPLLNGLWENDLTRSRSAQRIRAFQSGRPKLAVLSGMSSAYLFPLNAELPITARPIIGIDRWYEAYNAAIFLPSEGPVEHYHKSKLVAGVELMPFERVLGPLSALALDLGGTTGSLGQQDERSVLVDPRTTIHVVPAICYESVFGEHIAAHVRNGGELIAIMTNDGWWGDSPGPVQHLSFASIRAIETRRDIARSANTGISCFVDQRGVVHDRSTWWRPQALRRAVRLNQELTFFVRHGDLIGPGAVWASALLLVIALFRRSRNARGVK